MIRVCDVDALFIPGSMVFYVVRKVETSDGPPILLTRNELEMISAHRVVDMLVFHKRFDDELNLPVVSYVTSDKILFEPKHYIALTLDEFKNILEYDTDKVEIEIIGDESFVSSIKINNDNSGKIKVRVETASQMIQPIR